MTSTPLQSVVTANDDIVVTRPNSVVRVGVLDNDQGQGAVKIAALSLPAHGSVHVRLDGSLDYLPQTDFIGEDAFTYQLLDAAGNVANATVRIVVRAANALPVARDDHATTVLNQPIEIDAFANDNDPEGEPLRLRSITMPAHGSVTLTEGAKFRYQPSNDFLGTDTFIYTIDDGAHDPVAARVTVEVEPLPVPEGSATISVTTTVAQPVTIDLFGDERRSARLLSIDKPVNGSVQADVDGVIVYTPYAGFLGLDSFEFRADDGRGVRWAGEIEVDVQAGDRGEPFSDGTYFTDGTGWIA